jgi:16S rRNA (uracil1498-N3)-methyltransferase
MECFIVASSDVFGKDKKLFLRDDEARHAIRSLRMRIGERLIATDLNGTCYLAELVRSEENDRKELEAECTVLEILPEHHESKRNIILAQAILQQPSRFEEVLAKSTELGVTGFIPIISDRTEKKQVNTERIHRILREASKQVSRARLPIFSEPMEFEKAITESIGKQGMTIILHENASEEVLLAKIFDKKVNTSITLFIGPEGGFTEEEITFGQAQGAIIASLGSRRLRAETAAVAATSFISLLET